MEALKKFTDHLYGRKILEILANQELLLKADEVVLPGNLVDEIFLKVIEEFQKKDQGQFLSSLIIAKYPLYDVSSTYLSFDLRSIIAEECHRKSNLGQIFDGIDEKTWKKHTDFFLKPIEFFVTNIQFGKPYPTSFQNSLIKLQLFG
ncbi:hypothetical protein PtB15_7B479 [Puccinia triticina]|nr:hypothetical protein PtB15_7B479 [Puccinia triticina]